jgi:hypothetical protein
VTIREIKTRFHDEAVNLQPGITDDDLTAHVDEMTCLEEELVEAKETVYQIKKKVWE